MPAPHVVFAAGLDWLEGLLPFLFVVFWIVSQVYNAFKAAAGRGRIQPPAPRPRRPAAAAERDRGTRAELERQLDEFRERPRRQAGRPAAQRPAPPRPPADRGPQPLPAAKELAPARPSGPGGSDVARHVTEAFAHKLEHLASPLAAGGPVAGEPRRPAAEAPAAELVAALRNPATLRQVVLLGEVLQRPVDRW